MTCVDGSGRYPRAELERLFELVRNEQARANRGVVKHQELRTRRRAVDFAMGPPVVETTEVVSVRVREAACAATSDEIVHIDGSPNNGCSMSMDCAKMATNRKRTYVCVRAYVPDLVRVRACACCVICVRCMHAHTHTHTSRSSRTIDGQAVYPGSNTAQIDLS